MEKQIQRMITQYTNHLNSWKDSLRTYKNGLEKADKKDKELCGYWNHQIEIGSSKVETYSQIIMDLESIIS